MASIEKRIVSAILNTIRAPRDAPSAGKTDLPVPPAAAVAPARLREAFFSDFRGVAELKRRWGLFEDSIETWEHLWKQNPALAHMRSEPPIGWVLEAEGKIVGYLGNIALLCRYGDRVLTAVAGHGLAVDPPYRMLSLTLVAAFFRQKAVDLYLSTTAIEAVGRMARAFKCNPLPHVDYQTVLFWVLRPYPFAKSIMKMLGTNPRLARLGGVLAFLAISTDKLVRRRWPRKSSVDLAVTDISVREIGDSFQDLWQRKVNEEHRLLADRSAATLRWHFEIPGDRGATRVLCCSQNGELLGYAVIRDEAPDERTGLRISSIADMLVKKDEAAVIKALLVAAYGHAKSAGSHVLEVLGFPNSIRDICNQWHPYARTLRECRYHYKAADPTLHKTLSNAAAWYASPFDGDTTLTTRLSGSSVALLHPGNEVAFDVTEGTPTTVL